MKIIIPLAGFGKRMRPHTWSKPKPLLNVAGKPVLGHILDRLASLDSLTNIKNRRAFSKKALDEFSRAKRYDRPLSLMLIDIDYLKTINDTHGHLAGDEVIRYCASIMEKEIREQDMLGRLGGDEFGILLPETRLTESAIIGKRIQRQYRQGITLAGGVKLGLSISLGVAEITDGDQCYEDLFKRADQMLYKAKENGRNCLVFE